MTSFAAAFLQEQHYRRAVKVRCIAKEEFVRGSQFTCVDNVVHAELERRYGCILCDGQQNLTVYLKEARRDLMAVGCTYIVRNFVLNGEPLKMSVNANTGYFRTGDLPVATQLEAEAAWTLKPQSREMHLGEAGTAAGLVTVVARIRSVSLIHYSHEQSFQQYTQIDVEVAYCM